MMSEAAEQIDEGIDNQVDYEAEASTMGWADKPQWKGDPDKWIDAKSFVEKGRTVMPLLQANNHKLLSELNTERQARINLENRFKAVQTDLKVLEEHREQDVKAQVEERIAQLKGDIATASADGDHVKVANLTDELTQERISLATVKETTKETTTETGPVISQETRQWMQDNADLMAQPRTRMLMEAIGAELRQAGDTSVGPAFLEKVKTEAMKTLGKPPAGAGKAMSGNGGSGRMQSSSDASGKGFADLPKEAKDACERLAPRFVGKSYKTKADWQTAYAAKYFEQE